MWKYLFCGSYNKFYFYKNKERYCKEVECMRSVYLMNE